MSKQELNLVQFSASGMAQLRTRAAKIVRSQSGEAEFDGVLFHYVPDYPFGHTVAPVLACAADTSEYPAGGQIGRRGPDIHGGLHPLWHRHGADMPTLADEIDYGPVLLALL